MALDRSAGRSRRALLASAVGGAAAVAAAQLARPLPIAAADPDDIVRNTDNATTALTSITQATADAGALKGTAAGAGTGVEGASPAGIGVRGAVTGTSPVYAGVVGTSGDITASALAGATPDTALDCGVYGYAAQSEISSGIWGEAPTGAYAGVYGSGPTGVEGTGGIGVVGSGDTVGGLFFANERAIFAGSVGRTGVHAHVGSGTPPTHLATAALFGSVSSTSQVGLEARGRVRFPNRSGRTTISKGKSSVAISVSGVTSGNFAIATLGSNRSGRYVRAVVCSTGKITVYLNTSVTSATYVSWLVLG